FELHPSGKSMAATTTPCMARRHPKRICDSMRPAPGESLERERAAAGLRQPLRGGPLASIAYRSIAYRSSAYKSSDTMSPKALEPMARQTINATSSATKRVDPSPIPTTTPPWCLLLEPTTNCSGAETLRHG